MPHAGKSQDLKLDKRAPEGDDEKGHWSNHFRSCRSIERGFTQWATRIRTSSRRRKRNNRRPRSQLLPRFPRRWTRRSRSTESAFPATILGRNPPEPDLSESNAVETQQRTEPGSISPRALFSCSCHVSIYTCLVPDSQLFCSRHRSLSRPHPFNFSRTTFQECPASVPTTRPRSTRVSFECPGTTRSGQSMVFAASRSS